MGNMFALMDEKRHKLPKEGIQGMKVKAEQELGIKPKVLERGFIGIQFFLSDIK